MSDDPIASGSAGKWRKRLIYSLLTLIWLVVVSVPFLAFVLAANGEVRLGNDAGSHIRLFLLQEPDTQGIGIEWAGPSLGDEGCANSHVRYLLWEGTGISADYCRCVDSETGEIRFADMSCGIYQR